MRASSNKPFSIRLPVSTAAKLVTFCEINPQKNRTQHIADLLNIALTGYQLYLSEHHRQVFLHAVENQRSLMASDEPL